MINRELIRLKTIQVVYAYYQNGHDNPGKSVEAAEQELFFSLGKSHELYQALLTLILEVHRLAVEDTEQRKLRSKQLGHAEHICTKFVNNRFIKKLSQNKALIEFRDAHNQMWSLEEELIRNIYRKIQQCAVYQNYMSSPDSSFEEDRDLWRYLYKEFFCRNEEIDCALEDMSLYWNDDKFIIDTFILKTIKKTTPEQDDVQQLLPEYSSDEDKQYALSLLRYTLEGEEQFRALIGENLRNWDFSRIALMDLIIMQTALAEITSFPSIPLSVSINEYVNVAKYYSTPRSGAYINGMLDGIAKKLQEENKLVGK